MPFANWHSTYLNELQLPATLGAYTLTIAGVTGISPGLLLVGLPFVPAMRQH